MFNGGRNNHFFPFEEHPFEQVDALIEIANFRIKNSESDKTIFYVNLK